MTTTTRALIAGGIAGILSTTVLAGAADATASDECATGSEYRSARYGWRMEGMTRTGIDVRFGFDGDKAARHDGVLKRVYTGCPSYSRVVIKYRHFRAAPGPRRVWWVIKMDRRLR